MMNRLLWALFLLVPAAWADCPRIVSQSPCITHTLQWMGLEARIVGISRYDTLDHSHTSGVMAPDGVAIAALEPDLILTSDWTKPETLYKITPAGTQAIRLTASTALDQIADNLRRIGQADGLPDAGTRAEAFEAAMKECMATIRGDGQLTLLLSACGSLPYTFGPGTWLADLFGQLGFAVVATQPDTHMLTGMSPSEAIHAKIEQTGATRGSCSTTTPAASARRSCPTARSRSCCWTLRASSSPRRYFSKRWRHGPTSTSTCRTHPCEGRSPVWQSMKRQFVQTPWMASHHALRSRGQRRVRSQ